MKTVCRLQTTLHLRLVYLEQPSGPTTPRHWWGTVEGVNCRLVHDILQVGRHTQSISHTVHLPSTSHTVHHTHSSPPVHLTHSPSHTVHLTHSSHHTQFTYTHSPSHTVHLHTQSTSHSHTHCLIVSHKVHDSVMSTCKSTRHTLHLHLSFSLSCQSSRLLITKQNKDDRVIS